MFYLQIVNRCVQIELNIEGKILQPTEASVKYISKNLCSNEIREKVEKNRNVLVRKSFLNAKITLPSLYPTKERTD